MLMEPFEQPDKRIYEGNPQEELYPRIGDKLRERIGRSDDNEVVCGREGSEFDFERAVIRGLFDD